MFSFRIKTPEWRKELWEVCIVIKEMVGLEP